MNGALRFIDGEFDGNPGQGDGVAERNQVARAFRCLDGGDAGDAEDVTLLGGAVADQGQGCRLHEDAARGASDTGCFGLGADIDHVGLAGVVEMSQVGVVHRRYVWLRSAGESVFWAALS